MGMSASQARYLCLTARKNNVEFQIQQITQQKLGLTAQLDAEAALNHVGSYQIGEQTLTYRNLKEVRESIDYWQSKVNALKRGGAFKIHRAVPHR